MQVILAGCNLDAEAIRELQEACPGLRDLTPETISAAYARISRDPRPVHALRQAARGEVEQARKSNRAIVFEMGHSSIAEHAVFNIDILGVSRLLAEEIEKFRLASYTEKSQRYILLEDDVVLPAEIRDAGMEGLFREAVAGQNRLYHALYERLRPHVFAAHPEEAKHPARHAMLEGLAKEDARYVVSLATETQLGMTVNARVLELMIRRLAAHPLAEARAYSRALYGATREAAPSLVRYTEATEYDRRTRRALREAVQGLWGKDGGPAGEPAGEPAAVQLIEASPEGDERILAALLHTVSARPLSQCRERAGRLRLEEKTDLLRHAFRHLKPYDPVLREFEHVSLTFELVVSATCFAQLKRHRMITLTSQDYDPGLGVTIPPAVTAAGMEEVLREEMARTEEAFARLAGTVPEAAPYVLTNAHRRRVLVTLNIRELYHMARIRGDRTAQWDIRDTVQEMVAQARQVLPLATMLAAGKDGFAARYGKVFPEGPPP